MANALKLTATAAAPVIELDAVVTVLGGRKIHDGVSFNVRPGEVLALIGGSGVGKSVLLREIIGLLKPTSGSVRVFGESVWEITPWQMQALRKRFGVLFQDGALFSSLTVEQNVAAPLREHTSLPLLECLKLARLKLSLVGLPPDAAGKRPSELSGGMRKRVALARALALDPELLFLDEPTSGLDPISGRAFDHLIRLLSDSLGLTVFLVTHDLDTLFSIIDRAIVLCDGKVLGDGTIETLKTIDDPWLRDYFAARVGRGNE
jgi:phospholipid/cholesterol/gamma-HCH transport system ATP-binding protein